jgi:D-alanyl-D-alanine carboxypeptidase
MTERNFRFESVRGLAIALLALVCSCAGSPTPPAAPRPTAAAVPRDATPVTKPEPSVELPSSPLGLLARSLVDAVNVGKIEAQREFVRTRFSAKALKETPIEDWTQFLQTMWTQSGGIDVVAIPPSRAPNRFNFDVRSRRGRHFASLSLAVASADADRIDFFYCNPRPDPATLHTGVLVPAPVTEEEARRAIGQRAEQLAAQDRFSGTILVVKRDRVLVSAAVGQANKAFAAPNRLDTKFNLGSMNKMFTAVSVGQLVEKGKLSFTDSLAKALPDYPNRAFAARVTIHQLLTHTSGIGGDVFMPEVLEHRERFRRPADFLPLFSAEPAQFPPGERFMYANAGFVVLGAVVERLSGETYFDYVQNHVLAPAGMRDTVWPEIDEVVPNLAVGYHVGDDDPFALARRTNVMTLPFKGGPAGGGYSTAPDLRAFAAALRGHKLLSASMTDTVTSAKVDLPPPWPKGLRYGYGFSTRVVRGKEVRGNGGGSAGVNSELIIFWDGSYTVAIAGNYDPPAATEFADEIIEFLAAQGGA